MQHALFDGGDVALDAFLLGAQALDAAGFVGVGVLGQARQRVDHQAEAAFGRGLKKKVENMMASHAKRLELSLIYGTATDGLGVVKTGSSTSTVTGTVIITDATWSELAKTWNRQQLMDLVFAIGQYHLVAMALNSFGVQRDPGVPPLP